MKFNEVIKLIVKRSGGSMDKINLEEFIEPITYSFMLDSNSWLGVNIQKNPLDLMILQEILFEKRPDTIIECGTAYGGSAYYMACLMDLMNIDGKIFTIDHDVCQRPVHPKIEYIHSDCLAAYIPKKKEGKTMLILDCDHSGGHVYAELEKFSSMVTPGQYIIVEDTDEPDRSNGPTAGIVSFLVNNKNFVIDKSREKYGVSSNPGGYLLRTS